MDATIHHRVAVDDRDAFPCAESDSVLEGMERHGGAGIQVGCRRGGCGVCKVDVVSGTFASKRMSRAHVSADDERAGRVLSCRVYPTSDMVVRVVAPETTTTRTTTTTTDTRSASWQ